MSGGDFQYHHPRRPGKTAAIKAMLDFKAITAEPGETVLLCFHGLPNVIRTFDGAGSWTDRLI